MNGYSCDQCDSVFTNSSNMRRHVRFFHSNKKNFKCERCDIMFTRSDHLKRHCRRHNRVVKLMYCGVNGCRKSFTHVDKLDLHRKHHLKKLEEDVMIIKGISVSKKVENGSTRLFCPYEICDKTYSSYSGIAKHIKTHLDPPEKVKVKTAIILSCNQCSRTFKSNEGLEYHTKIKHSLIEGADNPRVFFVCPHEGCRKIYTTRGNLNMHIARNHDNKIIFKCDDCGCSFKWKKSLNLHKCKGVDHSL